MSEFGSQSSQPDGMARDWVSLAREVLNTEIQGLERVRDNLGPEFEQAVSLLAGCQGRVVVTGLGKSGLVGRKIAATLSSTGTPSSFLHPVEGAHGDLGMIRSGDVVVAISNSGETDELNAIIPALLSLGANIIGMTGNIRSRMSRMCHVTLCTEVPKEACTLGLAPTASTTATLALGDALAVALIEWKAFGRDDFRRFHPGGDLGRQLSMSVRALMHTEDVPTVYAADTLGRALEVLDQGGMGAVIVVDLEQRLQGILTDGDVRRMLCRTEYDLNKPIHTYMTPEPKYVTVDQKGGKVLDLMEKGAIMVLPVVDERRVLQGAVHMHDLLGKGRLSFNGMS
ncbi:KpsF/GutQ family sugar-phosphate isomerase [Desulfovermiculus halophilus]|jgi:arabinose-5-phosphate isomerase|uniref:KpsF/GutQ family sugar-phosphate isomerase n=1 Tax=Desulfovermiculus halophilus TaxID=339722 RepID=UPI000687087F|nr:KpsF/GutQ family sugar-phosphate isomerase [Desulfovermiculus halophilus]